jgi:hypothetical protein
MTRGALRDNDDGSKTQLFHWRSPGGGGAGGFPEEIAKFLVYKETKR